VMGIGLRVEGLVGKIWARCQIRFSQDAGGGGFRAPGRPKSVCTRGRQVEVRVSD